MPNLGLEIKRRCGICGKVFIIKTLDSLYCCKKCSDVAYARKKRAEAREKKLALIAKSVPKVREYISIREAVAIYGVERDTLYLMVRRGQIPSINIGTRLTRINRKDLERTATPSEKSARNTTSTIVLCGHMSESTPSPLVKLATMCMYPKKKLITYINQKQNEKTFIAHQSHG